MRILHIMGNGFDLNLGLKTRYEDFYAYYKQVTSLDNQEIEKLKASIGADLINWSDLELAFGMYTSSLGTHEDVETLVFDILDNLRDYLKLEQSKIDYDNLDRDVFLNDLITPEAYLTPREQTDIKSWADKWRNSQQIVLNIMTLNYTSIIEKIIGETSGINIGSKSGKKAVLSKIQHIHGFLDKRPILGVNDIEQIGNKKFHSSQDTVELLVKPIHNHELGHMVDDECLTYIKKANLICVFGCSIGETDKKWWAAIGERIGADCRLIIMHRTADFIPGREILAPRVVREVKDRFLAMTTLNEKSAEAAKNYISVGINTDMFKLKISSPVDMVS
jgi:hypothetical protein